ncbi:hypothetical protein B0F90DRAFT_164359 [Multifurca ochricompacta]|uniref:Paired amphipathic helix protein Sin3a n=1 Tax=Multifurca ochricompacta TaxID=376703 RepID=A0AAD4ME74_9AGAM|nr:hypothetical protein B0F90DRAFT_164359 [Multifurca ochricompacta]
MQALPLPKPSLPVRALTPASGPIPITAEHTPTSIDRSPPQPLPLSGAHEPRSFPRSPRPVILQDETQGIVSGPGGAGSIGGGANPIQPPLPSRLRSHDSLVSASALPRSRATSVKPELVQTESGNGNTTAANNGNNINRPLNVTDALSYLDAVKVQFHDKPDVYNHFLDIMKDFKSQIVSFGLRCRTCLIVGQINASFMGHPLD